MKKRLMEAKALAEKLLCSKKFFFSELKPSDLPSEAGVYAIFDKDMGETFYVGRTKNLRRRLYTNHEFTGGYFKLLAKKAAPRGYEPDSLVKAIWHGVKAMVMNDGSCKNEDAFWKDFASIYGEQKAISDRPLFNEFYANEFKDAKQFCDYNPKAAETVRWIKDKCDPDILQRL